VLAQLALYAWVTSSLGDSTSPQVLVAAGALERGRVWAGEWWRLGWAVLLHRDPAHLLLNAAVGLWLGRTLERALGTARFLVLYAVAGLAGSAASLLLQDAVAAGASGALFGLVGADLVRHRRAVAGWRPFLRSPFTAAVVILLASSAAVTLAVPLPIQVDHAAHAGGLLAGTATAWLLTSPAPRPAAWAALGAALALAVAAACWPRAGLSAFDADALERRIYRALRDQDQALAGALLDQAGRAGLDGDDLAYYRALLDVQQGRLEEAARRLRPLASGGAAAVRAEARRALAGVARNLGYRLYTGDGAPRDPAAGLGWFEEACAAGDQASCRDAARIRGP
jgi:rhomboid protease GluP